MSTQSHNRLRVMVRRLRAIFTLSFSIAIVANEANAHDLDLGRLIIGHPWATPGQVGASSKMHFTIRNEDSASALFTGVRSPVATEGKIRAYVEPGVSHVLNSIPIPAGEMLNFSTSHMWVDLSGLKEGLRVGRSFPVSLKFEGGRSLAIVVTVGEPSFQPSHHRVRPN